MQVTLKIFRYNPEKDAKPHFDTFTLEAEPTDRVLDLLEKIRDYHDGTLAYRRSCAHGICGSCAMRINGRNRLACKTLVNTLGTDHITVEPILGLPVIKDMVVDMGPFFENYRSVLPFFINDEPLPEDGRERIQSPEERARFDESTKCILCGACTTACPSFWADDRYLGPSAIVNAHRFIFDSRDRGAAERLKIVADQMGVWRCRTAYNCTEACPREIPITKLIAEVKQAALTGKIEYTYKK